MNNCAEDVKVYEKINNVNNSNNSIVGSASCM